MRIIRSRYKKLQKGLRVGRRLLDLVLGLRRCRRSLLPLNWRKKAENVKEWRKKAENVKFSNEVTATGQMTKKKSERVGGNVEQIEINLEKNGLELTQSSMEIGKGRQCHFVKEGDTVIKEALSGNGLEKGYGLICEEGPKGESNQELVSVNGEEKARESIEIEKMDGPNVEEDLVGGRKHGLMRSIKKISQS